MMLPLDLPFDAVLRRDPQEPSQNSRPCLLELARGRWVIALARVDLAKHHPKPGAEFSRWLANQLCLPARLAIKAA
jgi:hypothetical protein